jgi:hypothetical protein
MKKNFLDEARKTRVVEGAVAFFNSIHSYFFILFILLVFFVRFGLFINEEHYMALAKQFYNPEWIPGSFTLDEAADTRVLYQYLIGWPLQFLSFEIVSALGKLLLCVLIAWPLFRLYHLLGLSNIDVLLHLPIFYFSCQSFFAEEFIFLTLEPKAFAYVFVFIALYYLLREKYPLVVAFTVAATYFHLLIGGWFMVYFSLYHLMRNRSLKQTFLLGLLYLACLLPFLAYLSSAMVENFMPASTPVNIDWIYTYVKQPFHTALFLSTSYFVKNHMEGVLVFIAFFILCIFLFSSFKNDANQKINRLNICIAVGICISLVAAYFDKTGAFVKYFPFRINALFAFLVLLQTVLWIRYFLLKTSVLAYAQFGILVLFAFSFFPKAAYGFLLHDGYRFVAGKSVEPSFADVAEYIKNNTDRRDVVLVISKYSVPDNYLTFDVEPSAMRRMERDYFVAYSAAPVSPGTDDIYQWYRRLSAKNEIIRDYQELCAVKENFRIDYVLSDFKMVNIACADLDYSNESYFLYRVREK